jgi:hypothetical protein
MVEAFQWCRIAQVVRFCPDFHTKTTQVITAVPKDNGKVYGGRAKSAKLIKHRESSSVCETWGKFRLAL